MKIGIDLTWLGDRPAGVGTMVGEVLEELKRRKDVELVLFRAGSGLGKHWRLYKQIRAAELDVLWQVGDWLPLFMPKGLRTVQTVHDLISFDHPEWFPQSGFSKWWSQRFRVARSIQRADVVHCISRWTADQVKRLFPDTADRVVAAYQGVAVPEEVGTAVPDEINKPFLLALGTVEPRKNIAAICKAFLEFGKEYPEPHLVIAGREGWKSEGTINAIKNIQHQLPGRVHRLGYVDDETKWSLLASASALVMLSHAEGFGRPVVEAMTVGTPAIVAANSALKEVAEDAAILVHPDDTKKVARAMWRALYHPQLPGRVVKLGRERARRFSTQGLVDAVLTSVLTEG